MKISIKKRIIQSFCGLTCVILLAQVCFNVFLSKNYFVMQNKTDLEDLYNTIAEYYSDDVDVLYTLTQEADATKGYSVQILSDTGVIYTSRTTGTITLSVLPKEGQPPEGQSLLEQPQGESPMEQPQGELPLGQPQGEPPTEQAQGELPLEQPQGESPLGSAGQEGVRNGMPEGMAPDRYNLSPEELSFYSETPQAEILPNGNTGMEIIMLRGKIDYNGEARYINIALPMESITNSINLFTKSNIMISLFLLCIGIVLIIGLARKLTRPIKNIEEVSQKLADLDFSYMADESATTLELSSLASSINSMSRQLESSMDELQNANIELQKDVERQKELDSMRKQFVANVSHEMKTPLALVQIYCDNLKNNIGGKNQEKYCNIIIEETNRLNKIVSDMLNISSLENVLTQPIKEELDLSLVTKNLVDTMKPLLVDYKLNVDITPGLKVLGDKSQLEEAMRNYINNGIAHTNIGDEIKVSLKAVKDKVIFTLYNQGSSIPESHIERIWESFYKSDDARTRQEGTNAGLGLYVVKLTMDNHIGEYGARNVDGGVEFQFSLKVCKG